MKLQRLKNGQYIISLPSVIMRAKKWVKGNSITISINDEGDLVLKKLKND